MIEEKQRPWLILRLLPEMTRVRFYTLIDHFQSPELVLGASAQEIGSLRGFDEELARKILDAPASSAVEKEIELMEQHEVRLLTIEEDEYPANLRQNSFPPPLLYVRGRLAPHDRYAVALVGSRHATQYGRAVAQQFAGRLASLGITVVSGFARGVDSVAHDAALRAGGRTIGVLGNGLAVCYPAENRGLAGRICTQGALVSEYPMQTAPERYNFPERNHVIAAISLGTVVVEAANKSGALITANEALEENRFVFAVPGDINRNNSRGTNALIQAGARLVQSADDVLTEMRHLLRGYLREESDNGSRADQTAARSDTASPEAAVPNGLGVRLTEEESYIYGFIQHEPQYFDVLLARLDPERMPVQRLSSVLLSLELKQVVKQMPGKLYMASQPIPAN